MALFCSAAIKRCAEQELRAHPSRGCPDGSLCASVSLTGHRDTCLATDHPSALSEQFYGFPCSEDDGIVTPGVLILLPTSHGVGHGVGTHFAGSCHSILHSTSVKKAFNSLLRR